ncbi:hypothetical protein HPB47_008307 [Ixodes persulcatus]|uniref:Uncharacterized protein n=1 Tax=Ixodes persulcatus TaxID=34615 RepID=A0AC60P539_IXOPE|nr:hypothetical protein HPB47_008307 [Ixodes persulcatus]
MDDRTTTSVALARGVAKTDAYDAFLRLSSSFSVARGGSEIHDDDAIRTPRWYSAGPPFPVRPAAAQRPPVPLRFEFLSAAGRAVRRPERLVTLVRDPLVSSSPAASLIQSRKSVDLRGTPPLPRPRILGRCCTSLRDGARPARGQAQPMRSSFVVPLALLTLRISARVTAKRQTASVLASSRASVPPIVRRCETRWRESLTRGSWHCVDPLVMTFVEPTRSPGSPAVGRQGAACTDGPPRCRPRPSASPPPLRTAVRLDDPSVSAETKPPSLEARRVARCGSRRLRRSEKREAFFRFQRSDFGHLLSWKVSELSYPSEGTSVPTGPQKYRRCRQRIARRRRWLEFRAQVNTT